MREEQEVSKVVNFMDTQLRKQQETLDEGDLRSIVHTFFTSTEKGVTFEPVIMSEVMNSHYDWFYQNGVLYRYYNGVYRSDGESFFKQEAQRILGKLSRRKYVEEVLYHLKNNTALLDDDIKINPNDEYINVKNGLVNYITGELIPHTPERLSTIQLPVEYNQEANDTVIIEFIKSLVPKDTIDLIFEMIGYCLLTTTKYEKAFMFVGAGGNGKSTVITLIQKLLGESNISNIPLQQLGDRFNKAALYGKLLNSCADIPFDKIENSSEFKMIVSGDSLNAEFKGKDVFEFKPFAKLIFSANRIPQTNDFTEGFFRRWIFIPFDNPIPQHIKDVNILGKLTTPAAMSTLLNLALEGLNRIIRNNKFTENESTNNLINTYRKDANSIVTYINEECKINENCIIPVKDLYDEYALWCEDAGFVQESKHNFNEFLEKQFTKKKMREQGTVKWCWIGIETDRDNVDK